MRVRVVVTAAALLLATAASAEPGRSTLGVGLGMSYMEARDDLLVPLRFIGPRLTMLRPEYRVRTDRDWLGVDAGFGLAALFDRYGFITEVFPLDARAQYLRRVGAGRLLVGAQARWSVDVQVPEMWDDEHNYWLTAVDLAPAVGYARPVGRAGSLEAALAVPVAALLSRPTQYRYVKTEPSDFGHVFGQAHTGLRLATLDEYQAAQLTVAWRRPLRRAEFTLGYRGRFARAASPLPVWVLEHSLNVAWGWGL